MGIPPSQILYSVVVPTLEYLNHLIPHTIAAEELVLGTGLVESDYNYITQVGGHAMGFWQMELATHDSLWNTFISRDITLKTMLYDICGDQFEMFENLIGNMYYACAMCRILYRAVPSPLPKAGDVQGMANYWKVHYNTPAGKGTVTDYIQRWNTYQKG